MNRRPHRMLPGLPLGLGFLLLSCQSGDQVSPPANMPPVATITLPTAGTLFSGGDTIDFAGGATDAEDGTLAASQLSWWADLHHDTHTHPWLPQTNGVASGQIVVPPRGHTEDNIFLRIYLAATDADGAVDTTYVDVQPRKVTLAFASVPSGLQLTLDGQPHVTPFSVVGVVGMERDLGAPTPQVVAADSLLFVSWSDAGAALHTVVTPAVNTTYTATYQVVAVVNQHPVVNITSPAGGATITQGTLSSITATASDPDGTVASVDFLDGATVIGTDNSSPYSVPWTPAATGAHSLTARATDNAGAMTTSAPVSVTVVPPGADGTPPTVQLTAPTEGSAISGAVNLAATASDNVGVVGVLFQVDGVSLPEDLTAPYQATAPATSLYATGVHVVRARARDAAGNLSPWSTVRVTFDGGTLPNGFSRTTFVSGITSGRATTMAFAPDGRLFIAEQDGALRVVTSGGTMLATPFVTVNTSANGERGLLGVAFHPQFATNHWVYLYYTAETPNPHNRIVRYTANGDVSTGVETVLVDLPDLSSATNHNGGALHFGPDGKLYVAVGENANGANAQSMTIPFGKMLRFNDDGTIPTDNPFYGSTTGINRSIWAKGLRNPFTFGFQPGTGRMLINDVGEGTWEEINDGAAGANYGWPNREGTGGAPTYVDPIYFYGHSSNPSLVTGQAIVGSAFYNPSTVLFPAEYVGSYFFGDYVAGWVKRMDIVNDNAVYSFWNGSAAITDVQVGPDGALYVLGDLGSSWGVHRIGRP
jgi:glucose/arabinose dehydrogenase